MEQSLAPLGPFADGRRPASSLDASADAYALIKHFEKFSPTKYYCTAGMPTIGYGHVILFHEAELHAAVLTEAQATELLRQDVRKVERALWSLVTAPVLQHEYDALLCLAFNTGPGKADGVKGDFADSTLLQLLNAREYLGAAMQFDRWVFSRGRRLAGLARRRYAERALFEGFDWRAADDEWLANYERGA